MNVGPWGPLSSADRAAFLAVTRKYREDLNISQHEFDRLEAELKEMDRREELMSAKAYGRYDVFDDETALTWEQAEALALRARGQDVPIPPAHPLPPYKDEATIANPQTKFVMPPVEGPPTQERHLLNRALILLIHLRERVFKEDPQVAAWVNDILTAAKE